jgi:hypothetical protein
MRLNADFKTSSFKQLVSWRALEQNLAAAPAFFREIFRLQFLGAFYV